MGKIRDDPKVNEKGYFIGTRRKGQIKPLSNYLDSYEEAELALDSRGWPNGAAIYRVTEMHARKVDKD